MLATIDRPIPCPADGPPGRRPARRRSAAAIGAALALALLLSACLTSAQSSAASALNRDRNASGIRSLGTQRDAQTKAQAWANRLASENRLYHSTLASGIRARWCGLGENVGVGSSVAAVEKAFMASSPHRANILGRSWNGMGVGVAHRGSRVYVVHEFIKTC